MKNYITEWTQGGVKGVYKTKTLTKTHRRIHESNKVTRAKTIMTDSSVKWALGLYSELVAYKDNDKPKNNIKFK